MAGTRGTKRQLPPQQPMQTKAPLKPEDAPQPASPLETATANAQALEAQVIQAMKSLNEMRTQLLKWQGAAEFLASLERPAGPGNGADKETGS